MNRVSGIELYDLSLDSVADLNDLKADSFMEIVGFQVLKAGTSLLTLSANAAAGGNGLAVTTLSAPETTVPLPPAMLLMLSGLLGLGWVGSGQIVTRRSRVGGACRERIYRLYARTARILLGAGEWPGF